MKKCTKCGIEKDEHEFYKSTKCYTKKGSGGKSEHIYIHSWCKICENSYWSAKQKEQHLNGPGKGSSFKKYWEDLKQSGAPHPGIKRYWEKYHEMNPSPCCKILIKHHELLKDDPERLSTEFIKKMSNCSCDLVKE
jgi:hypothetical protein